MPALHTLQNLIWHLLPIGKVESCGYKTPCCYGPLALSDPETPHCAAEQHPLAMYPPFYLKMNSN